MKQYCRLVHKEITQNYTELILERDDTVSTNTRA